MRALDWCECSASWPGHFTHGERAPVPIEEEGAWPQSQSGCFGVETNLMLPGFAPQIIQPITYSLNWLFHSGLQQRGNLENYNNYSSTTYSRHIRVSLLSSMPHELLLSMTASFSPSPPLSNMLQIPLCFKPFLQRQAMFAHCNSYSSA